MKIKFKFKVLGTLLSIFYLPEGEEVPASHSTVLGERICKGWNFKGGGDIQWFSVLILYGSVLFYINYASAYCSPFQV